MKNDIDSKIFKKLEQDVVKYGNIGNVMLIGDINAHMNEGDLDYIQHDMNDILDDCLPNNYIADNVYLSRCTQVHQTTNTYGKNILDICIGLQLRILNGRTLEDSSGKPTFYGFHGTSIDDYCICSASTMKDVINFKVHGYNPHLSDHCKISVKIQSRFTFHEQQQLRAAPQNIKWSEAQENKFLRNLDNDRIKVICSEIDKLEQNHSSEKEFQILFSEYSDMLHKAAFGINPPSNKKRRKRKAKKPWYDFDCGAKYRHIKYLSWKLSLQPWNKELRLKLLCEETN